MKYHIGDKVQVIRDNGNPRTPYLGIGTVTQLDNDRTVRVDFGDGHHDGNFPGAWIQTARVCPALAAPLPPTEDVLSALLVEQRRTNDLLTQLLSKPTLTLHGQERDWQDEAQARADEAYSMGTQRLHDVYRRRGPQREL